jgi:hypothetical protein
MEIRIQIDDFGRVDHNICLSLVLLQVACETQGDSLLAGDVNYFNVDRGIVKPLLRQAPPGPEVKSQRDGST